MANLWNQVQSFIPGVEQMFQNVGYQDQQAGRDTSVGNTIQGLAPKTSEGVANWAAKMNPFNPSGAQAYTPAISPTYSAPQVNTGGGGAGGGGGGEDKLSGLRDLEAKGDLNPAQRTELEQMLASQNQGPSPEDLARQEAERQLNSGYDAYYKQLDEQLASLGGQRTGQEQIAQNTYDQGYNTATNQLGQAQQSLDTNRQKTLRDLSSNLSQSWQQGNIALGTRGASDSSAANQYSYALSKLGSQQRGDVQGQYDQNMFQLKNTYDTETKNLELQKNTQLQQISQWFAEAQNQLKSQKGQAALQKSQQALSYAMQMAQQVQQESASRRSTLDQWVANHATSFQELAQGLSRTGAFSMQAPQTYNLVGNQAGGGGVATGYGQGDDELNRGLFG